MNLEVTNLSYGYTPACKVLKDISFSVKRGECAAIMGTNGVGKSTLLKCLNHILRPQAGNISVEGECIRYMDSNTLARRIGYVAQNTSFADVSVFDAVLLGRKPYIKWDVTKQDLHIVQDIMERMDLTDFALRRVDLLSGGEAQKVAIARALAQQPDVLLFDEPTSNLDLKNQLEVITLIREIVREQNISAVVTMHDLNLALRFADQFLFVCGGSIFAAGGHEVVNEENIYKVYGVRAAVEELHGRLVVIPF